jgi:hypothetical protein
MRVKIVPNDSGTPAGKLADAELHFTDGELEGLKLVGFAIWSQRGGAGPTVSFPVRQFTVSGERRRFLLLRAIENPAAQERLRDRVLRAYSDYQRQATSWPTE